MRLYCLKPYEFTKENLFFCCRRRIRCVLFKLVLHHLFRLMNNFVRLFFARFHNYKVSIQTLFLEFIFCILSYKEFFERIFLVDHYLLLLWLSNSLSSFEWLAPMFALFAFNYYCVALLYQRFFLLFIHGNLNCLTLSSLFFESYISYLILIDDTCGYTQILIHLFTNVSLDEVIDYF